MSFTGHVVGGSVVLDGPIPLPDGTPVRVDPIEARPPTAASPLGQALLDIAGRSDGLPDDLAAQHDHYLYGTPKR